MKRVKEKLSPINALLLPASYLGVSLFMKFASMSVIYFIYTASNARFAQASEVVEDQLLTSAALSAALVTSFMLMSVSINAGILNEFFQRQKGRSLVIHSLMGLVFGLLLIGGMIFGNILNFLGFMVKAPEAVELIFNLLLRTTVIIAFVFGEEFIFRQKILKSWLANTNSKRTAIWITLLVATVQVIIRNFQFEMVFFDSATLFFISLAASFYFNIRKSYIPGAAAIAGFYIFTHVICSSPLFGTEFSGLFVIQPSFDVSRLSGGEHGPLASLVSCVLMAYLSLRLLRGMLKKQDLPQAT